MQFPKDLTETECKAHVLKIKAYSTTKMVIRSCTSTDCISYGALDAGGCDWAVRYYPNHSDLSKEWVAFRLVLLHKRSENEVKATFRCQLADESGILPTFGGQSVTCRYMNHEDVGPPLFLAKHEELLKSGHLKDDSFDVKCTIRVLGSPQEVATDVNLSVAVPSTDLHQHFGELLESQKGADIKFVVSGESFMAHKAILAVRSPIFMAEFFGPMKESSLDVVEIKDIEPEAFKAMLHFIYTDTCPALAQQHTSDMGREVVAAMAQHLLAAADRYGLDRLKLICEDKLYRGISVETAATTLALADQHGCSRLKTRCIQFIIGSPENLDSVMATEAYKHLMASCPLLMNDLLKTAVVRR
ncbi:hypothetical protein ACP70R_041502 [Stipagrostis hirtigluma subsp. patula]